MKSTSWSISDDDKKEQLKTPSLIKNSSSRDRTDTLQNALFCWGVQTRLSPSRTAVHERSRQTHARVVAGRGVEWITGSTCRVAFAGALRGAARRAVSITFYSITSISSSIATMTTNDTGRPRHPHQRGMSNQNRDITIPFILFNSISFYFIYACVTVLPLKFIAFNSLNC